MQINTATMPAEEALFLGAAFAHIAAHNEHHRLRRIDRQNRLLIERRRGGRALR